MNWEEQIKMRNEIVKIISREIDIVYGKNQSVMMQPTLKRMAWEIMELLDKPESSNNELKGG